MELLLLVGDLELEHRSYLGHTGQPHTKVHLGASDTGTRIEMVSVSCSIRPLCQGRFADRHCFIF